MMQKESAALYGDQPRSTNNAIRDAVIVLSDRTTLSALNEAGLIMQKGAPDSKFAHALQVVIDLANQG